MSAANWGFEWGSATWGEVTLDARSRLLMFLQSGPNITALAHVFSARTEALLDTASDVAAAFDLDSGEGVHLDRLGAVLQMPRYGYSDARYRTILQIQVELILSSASTTPTIMRIVERFTGLAPISYAEAYPMGFSIGAEIDDADDIAVLLGMIGQATSAAYQPWVITSASDALILDYLGDAIADAGLLDYLGDAIAGAGSLSYTHAV